MGTTLGKELWRILSAQAYALIRSAVSRLLDNQGLNERFGAQAKAWGCQERSWSKTTSVYLEIYDKAQRMNSFRRVSARGSRSCKIF